jgi:hypothetical protein
MSMSVGDQVHVEYLHVTYAHPPVHFTSSLDYLSY